MSAAASDAAVVVVIGATGNVGSAAVKALSAKGITTRAGSRDPASAKAAALGELDNVTAVAADLSAPETLAAAFEGATAVLFNPPASEDRAALVVKGIEEATKAGVKHIAVMGVLVSGVSDAKEYLFGRQWGEIEAAAVASGIPYTFLRMPMFLENQFGNVGSIKGEGKIYAPVPGDAEVSSGTTSDFGEAAAAVLADPAAHANKAYNLATAVTTHNKIAAAFAKELGKEVTFVQVPPEGAKAAMLGAGFPEWQVGGVLELFAGIAGGKEGAVVPDADLKALLGRDPTTAEQFIGAVKGAFQ